jgi:hypothetical protein
MGLRTLPFFVLRFRFSLYSSSFLRFDFSMTPVKSRRLAEKSGKTAHSIVAASVRDL